MYRKCDLLTTELTELERLSDGHIDHPKNGSKDQADAVCGALYLASMFSEEYSYSYGESIDASLDANDFESEEIRKMQMMLDFQKELANIYAEVNEGEKREAAERRQRQVEYQAYQDILDGIICI